MSDFVLVPNFSLKPNALTLYETLEGQFICGNQSEGFKNLENNENKYGDLSNHSVKRLRKTIDYMLYLSKEKTIIGKQLKNKFQDYTTENEQGEAHQQPVKYKLTFITLTLPAKQRHSDNEIKSKALNHFLTELRRKYKVEMYIWKAEKQENGNIHFHIITDKFCHHAEIRKDWNKIINKLGYVLDYQRNMREYYKDGFKLSENPKDKRTEPVQRAAYTKSKSENFLNPNSTDIHALHKIKNLAAYMSKYLAKGVTKTDRVKQIDSLIKEQNEIEKEIIELEKEVFFLSETDKKYKQSFERIDSLRQRKEEIPLTLQDLRDQGVSGKIWGCSQVLSRCKNLTSIENWIDIPDIAIVDAIKTFESEIDLGTRKFTTKVFDIQKTPNLKNLLNFHLQTILSTCRPSTV